MKRSFFLFAAILLVAASCSDFYSTLGGGGTGTTGSTGTEFRMISSYPAYDASGIPVNPLFEFQFNNQVRQSTVSSNFKIYDASDTELSLSGTTIYNTTDGMGFRVNGLTLAAGQQYRIVITAGLQNTSGLTLASDIHITFWTGSGGGTGFYMISSSPNNGDTISPVSTSIFTIQFSKDLYSDTVNNGTVSLFNNTLGIPVSGLSITTSDTKSISIQGFTPFFYGNHSYTIKLSTGIRDTDGNMFDSNSDIYITFTTSMDANAPGPVTGLTATVIAAGTVNLNWSPPGDGDFDHVVVSINSVPWYTVLKGTPAWDLSGLTAGNYIFSVTTYDSSNNAGMEVSTSLITVP